MLLQEIKQILHTLHLPIIVILAVYVVKLTITTAKKNWSYLLRQAVVSLVVGLLAHKYFFDLGGYTEGFLLVMTAFFAFEADNMLRGLSHIGSRMRDDPIALAKEIRDIFRGK